MHNVYTVMIQVRVNYDGQKNCRNLILLRMPCERRRNDDDNDNNNVKSRKFRQLNNIHTHFGITKRVGFAGGIYVKQRAWVESATGVSHEKRILYTFTLQLPVLISTISFTRGKKNTSDIRQMRLHSAVQNKNKNYPFDIARLKLFLVPSSCA